MISRIKSIFQYLRENRFDRSMMRYFDWPLFLIVIAISLFGIVCIFSATSTEVTEVPSTIMEMLETQPHTYSQLQLNWLLAGIAVMALVMIIPYDLYGQYANVIYLLNLVLLVVVLFMERGRGDMAAFFKWNAGERGFQPSEVGKVAMIIAFAKAFSVRIRPIMKLQDIIPLVIYMGIPLLLIVAQPDVGTALVYLAVFCIMVFVSGTNYKLILSVLGCLVVLVIPVWYFMNNSASDNFRLMRILIWLNPEAYPDDAWQVINAQTAIGSAGMFGKGLVSPGSYASLGYISDDHTDFIFAIVCEAFGFAGGGALIAAYLLMIARLIYLAVKVQDPYGSYLVIGVMAMMLFHVVENIGMVIGLLPVTGIPLPFVSYGGSNMLTNMMAIGLVQNVVIRSEQHEQRKLTSTNRLINL